MSAIADVIRGSERAETAARDLSKSRAGFFLESQDWKAEEFATEQLRGLVRQVFFSTDARAVKQVVFSSVGRNPNLGGLCDKVGHALALETSADVAIVGGEQPERVIERFPRTGSAAIKSWSTQIRTNLWRVPEFKARECQDVSGTAGFYLSCLTDLRREFEYTVIHGPAAGISSDAALLGELTDGIILVLAANSSRRATARRTKEALEATRSRILGTVLSERRFPIPEGIYRRL
jgi:hypothetical protein